MTSVNTSVNLVLAVGQNDHLEGLITAPIILLEYGDYQSPCCAQAVFINGIHYIGNWDTETLLSAIPHHGSYANEHY